MIEFLMDSWLWFLIAMVTFVAVGAVLQLLNMKSIVDGKVFESGVGDIFKRFGCVMVFMLLGSLSGIALIISIVLNAIEYFNNGGA